MMTAGMPTHFERASGEPVAIETYVHLFSDHVTAARATVLSLIEMRERLIDDPWIALKPRWGQYRNHPVSWCGGRTLMGTTAPGQHHIQQQCSRTWPIAPQEGGRPSPSLVSVSRS
jgi:hypothetical protein